MSRRLAASVMFGNGTPKNSRIVMGTSLIDSARLQAEMGVSTPWEKLTALTRGIRLGETWYWGAGVKMGKSTLVNHLTVHCVLQHGWSAFVAKPEESNNKTFKLLAGTAAGKIFHDPNIPMDVKAYDEAANLLHDKIMLLDLYQHVGWESLRADIVTAAMLGAKLFIIDPLTNLTNGVNAGDANTMLQSIAQDLAALAKDLDISVHVFCHLLSPNQSTPHERGGKVMSSQFAGSRGMMRSCNYMIGLEGNKDPDLPEDERNLRRLVILEDREFGTTGVVPLWYNNADGRLLQV